MAGNGMSRQKRREIVTLWMKQLFKLHERQGTSKPAAGGWIGAVYALRAASRLDGNREWGKLGDEIISHLEQAYLAVLGPDAAKPVEVGRDLLQTQRKPDLPLDVASGLIDDDDVARLRQAAARAHKASGGARGAGKSARSATARGKGRTRRRRAAR